MDSLEPAAPADHPQQPGSNVDGAVAEASLPKADGFIQPRDDSHQQAELPERRKRRRNKKYDDGGESPNGGDRSKLKDKGGRTLTSKTSDIKNPSIALLSTPIASALPVIRIPSRNSFAGKSIMFAFDTPDLGSADVERRLRAILPMDSTTDIDVNGNRIPYPPPKPVSVHQLPHSTLHVLPNVNSSFLAKVFSAENLLGTWDLDEESIPLGFDLQLNSTTGMPERMKARLGEIEKMLETALPEQISEYERSYRELEEMVQLAHVLARVTPEDLTTSAAKVQ
ncbi:hypothetical protein HDU97_007511 [Phlyctochytrium planicorne]|nr:hypothetical protein HDU97_007511 [Phlyctochytrium planicorne]